MARTLDVARSLVSDTVSRLATGAARALQAASTSYRERDVVCADRIVRGDRELNDLALQVEERCIEVIARHQPVADDLRFLMAAVKIASNLERIGDHAAHVAREARRLPSVPSPRESNDLETMASLGVGMVKDAVSAFVRRDGGAARAVAARDDEVDAIFASLTTELFTEGAEEQRRIRLNHSLFRVGKSLERIGDHVCNICEAVLYLVDGEHEELNS
jgi:phosphate transport system protein